jgi:hypothetical protein
MRLSPIGNLASPVAPRSGPPGWRPRLVASSFSKRTCATEYPGMPLCSSLPPEYVSSSPSTAFMKMKSTLSNPHLSLHGPRPNLEGPCEGYLGHYNVRYKGERQGSIGCCPCCVDTDNYPVLTERCRIIW